MSQEILVRECSSQALVAARFHEDVSAEKLAQAESQWKPHRIAAIERLVSKGMTLREAHTRIQHAHWNWVAKAQGLRERTLDMRSFGIEISGEWQGLMIVELAAHGAELGADRGKPLVYIEFLESAPWNLRETCDSPRFGLIGVRLVEAAVRLSIAEGFHGRVGLHALPQAEPFYEKRCLMKHVEGAVKHGMKLYEMTREDAVKFLGEGR
jgi:hypothetical protein